MNDPVERERLEAVLDAFVASSPDPNSAALASWIDRYPEYASELTAFAVSWSLMESLPSSPAAETLDEETLVLRGMSVFQNLLHRQETGQDVAPTLATAAITSLLDEGRSRGFAPRQLAQAMELGDSVLRKLDRRLIRFNSIPVAAIERLAAAVQRPVDTIARYLQQHPTFAAAAQHRAEEAPQLAEPEDFFDAVRSDPMMTEEQRAYWLAFSPR